MKRVILRRLNHLTVKTFGVMYVEKNKFFTVELPWDSNKNNISCIPTGIYRCKWTKSPRLKKFTFEVTNVPNRAGIRIHSGNFPKQFLGCIGLGLQSGFMDKQPGVFLSKPAIRKFEALMGQDDFELEIR